MVAVAKPKNCSRYKLPNDTMPHDQLWTIVKTEHSWIVKTNYLERAYRAGLALNILKAQRELGRKWLDVRKENYPALSNESACVYMGVAKYWPQIKKAGLHKKNGTLEDARALIMGLRRKEKNKREEKEAEDETEHEESATPRAKSGSGRTTTKREPTPLDEGEERITTKELDERPIEDAPSAKSIELTIQADDELDGWIADLMHFLALDKNGVVREAIRYYHKKHCNGKNNSTNNGSVRRGCLGNEEEATN